MKYLLFWLLDHLLYLLFVLLGGLALLWIGICEAMGKAQEWEEENEQD